MAMLLHILINLYKCLSWMSSGTRETLPDFSRGFVCNLPSELRIDSNGKTQASSTIWTHGYVHASKSGTKDLTKIRNRRIRTGYPQLCGYTADFFEKPLERHSSKTDPKLIVNHGVQVVRERWVWRPLEKSKGKSLGKSKVLKMGRSMSEVNYFQDLS
jgi:hypothetical protein